MDVHIDSQKENKLFDRNELYARLGYTGATPPRKEIREAIARKAVADPALVAIRRVINEYGKCEVRVEAHVYANKQAYEKYEPHYVLVRQGEKEKKAKKKKEKKAAAPKKG